MLEQRTLRVRYAAPRRGAETEREIDPYHLRHVNGALYLVGYCHLAREVRTFAVERIQMARVTAKRFDRPADFDIETYLGGAWGIVRGDPVTVRVRFGARMARYVAERRWHPSQTIRERPDGGVDLTLRVADTWEVRRWILGFGAQAEVLEPASMREALRAEVEAMTRRFGDSMEARREP